MRTIATPTYYCVAFAQNCVANCSATPDKLFPVLLQIFYINHVKNVMSESHQNLINIWPGLVASFEQIGEAAQALKSNM